MFQLTGHCLVYQISCPWLPKSLLSVPLFCLFIPRYNISRNWQEVEKCKGLQKKVHFYAYKLQVLFLLRMRLSINYLFQVNQLLAVYCHKYFGILCIYFGIRLNYWFSEQTFTVIDKSPYKPFQKAFVNLFCLFLNIHWIIKSLQIFCESISQNCEAKYLINKEIFICSFFFKYRQKIG